MTLIHLIARRPLVEPSIKPMTRSVARLGEKDPHDETERSSSQNHDHHEQGESVSTSANEPSVGLYLVSVCCRRL